jgi:CRP-like cAMP-binding protein
MKKVNFFQQMEAQTAGIVNRLAIGVTLQDFPSGQVIFRQQDPPGNCYVLLSGEVDVHIVPKEELPSEGETVRRKRLMTPRTCQDWDISRFITMLYAQKFPGNPHTKKEREAKDYRWLSFEGFSCYCEESRLGKIVTTLKEGACFGELALQSSKPRAATIRCKTDCSMYIISQEHFQKVMGEVMAKIQYFDSCLPGVKQMKYRQLHPSIHFQCSNFPEGHKFLHEGIIANDAVVFLLKSGTVEFRRYMTSSENPAYVLSNTPLQESSWKSSCARPLTGVAGSQHKSTAPSSPNSRRQNSFDMGGQVTWDVMDDQGVWCSLAFFPLNSVEPFTVVAVTPVEVYWSAGSEALSMPPDLLLKLRTSLLRQMKERTRQLPDDVFGNPETVASFNATTESFGRVAYSTFRSTFRTSLDSNLASTVQSRASLGSSLKSSTGNEEALLRRHLLKGGKESPGPSSPMRVTFSDLAMAR